MIHKLFEPITIGKVKIKNRVAMAPMIVSGLLNPDGSLSQRCLDYYVKRAEGGVGLIITGFFKVENSVEPFTPGIPLISRTVSRSFAELSEAANALGTKVFVQLTAGFGRVANPLRLRGQLVSASKTPSYWKPNEVCRDLTIEEIKMLVKGFGDAAETLASAGIDGIELHGHEGYLFDQFTTAVWNKRTDEYGGNLAARLRLPIEVLQEIKDRIGQNFPIQYRYGLKHYMKGLNSGALPSEKFTETGRDIAEGLQIAKTLENAGFDALHVDAGCYESWYWSHPPIYQEHGCIIDMAAEVKKFVNIPVIGVGKLEIPELAEQMIAENKVDIIAIGRGLLADAFWVNKVRKGRLEYIRPCIGCHDGCLGQVMNGKPLSCSVNPMAGREGAYSIKRAYKSKRIIIVGGGVAGLEAARVSALRGHKVTLYEKTKFVGGHLIEASVPEFKKDLARLLDWYRGELRNLDLEIKLSTKVDPILLEQEKPDAVVIATGSKPIVPNVPGIKKDKVVTATDILLGKKKARKNVFIFGGGLIGCETALWLALQGKRVTIVEALKDLMIAGIPVQHANKLMLSDLLKFHNINVMVNTSLSEVTESGVLLIDKTFREKSFDADTIVLATGLRPDRRLYNNLEDKIPNIFLIGDSKRIQNIKGAIWDAYEVARTI